MKSLFPKRLKMARKMRGLSMDELVSKMGTAVSKQSVSKYERGIMMPRPDILAALADVLQVSENYFFREATKVGNINFRFMPGFSASAAEMVVCVAQDKLEKYIELEKILNVAQEFKNPLRRCEVRDFDDVECAANRLRAKWGLGDAPLHSVYQMLESHGVKVLEFESELKGFLGLSAMMDGKIPLIVINKSTNNTVERKRFTALHELAHIVLFTHEEKQTLLSEPSDEIERLCHRFAGAMLCPDHVFVGELGEKRTMLTHEELSGLKCRYGISVAAAVHRAKDIGVISERYYNYIFDNYIHSNPLEEGWGGYGIPECANRYERLLQRAIAEGVVAEEDMKDFVGEELNCISSGIHRLL